MKIESGFLQNTTTKHLKTEAIP